MLNFKPILSTQNKTFNSDSNKATLPTSTPIKSKSPDEIRKDYQLGLISRKDALTMLGYLNVDSLVKEKEEEEKTILSEDDNKNKKKKRVKPETVVEEDDEDDEDDEEDEEDEDDEDDEDDE